MHVTSSRRHNKNANNKKLPHTRPNIALPMATRMNKRYRHSLTKTYPSTRAMLTTTMRPNPKRMFSANATPTHSTQTTNITNQLDVYNNDINMNNPRKKVHIYRCIDPQVPYHLGHEWMHTLLQSKTRKESPEERDIMFVVQHQPVYTLGRGASLNNFKFNHETLSSVQNDDAQYQFDVQRIGRGGEVTYHGPGQLTVYPIINLNNYKRDLHWYVSQLESTVIHTLAKYGINGGIDNDNPGVWVGDAKVSAIGCQFTKWTTMHGFSININNHVHNGFNRIVPCGIQDKHVTTLQQLIETRNNSDNGNHNNINSQLVDKSVQIVTGTKQRQPPKRFLELPTPDILSGPLSYDMDDVADQIIDSFAKVFDVDTVENDYSILDYYDRSIQTASSRPRVWLRDTTTGL